MQKRKTGQPHKGWKMAARKTLTQKPDDATIERVAKAIEATMFAPHELPLDDELHGKYRETAEAAIRAMQSA